MSTNKFFDLSGQHALVTGAATGIGEAIARRLLAAGAAVAFADCDEEALRAALARCGERQDRARAVVMDVASPGSVTRAVEEALAWAGALDVLVNNAGIAGRAAPLWEQSEEEWARVMEVNLNGVFRCTKAVLPHMRARQYGRIVNIASIAGKEGNPNMTAYSASKAAVIGFTKAAAKEVATEGICVNCVAPAVIRTRILEQLTPEQVDYMTSRIPMRRPGTLEEVASLVHFLASSEASFVTGQCYDVSGGRATY